MRRCRFLASLEWSYCRCHTQQDLRRVAKPLRGHWPPRLVCSLGTRSIKHSVEWRGLLGGCPHTVYEMMCLDHSPARHNYGFETPNAQPSVSSSSTEVPLGLTLIARRRRALGEGGVLSTVALYFGARAFTSHCRWRVGALHFVQIRCPTGPSQGHSCPLGTRR